VNFASCERSNLKENEAFAFIFALGRDHAEKELRRVSAPNSKRKIAFEVTFEKSATPVLPTTALLL
jgi:hypothetical protein